MDMVLPAHRLQHPSWRPITGKPYRRLHNLTQGLFLPVGSTTNRWHFHDSTSRTQYTLWVKSIDCEEDPPHVVARTNVTLCADLKPSGTDRHFAGMTTTTAPFRSSRVTGPCITCKDSSKTTEFRTASPSCSLSTIRMLEEPSKILYLSYPRPLPHLPSSPRPSQTNLVGKYGILHHFCAGELVVDVAWVRFNIKLDALAAAFDGVISSSEAKTASG